MSANRVHERQYAIASEIADLYRTSAAQVYQWVRESKFPKNCVLRIGKKLLFDLTALNEWAEKGGSPASSTQQEMEGKR